MTELDRHVNAERGTLIQLMDCGHGLMQVYVSGVPFLPKPMVPRVARAEYRRLCGADTVPNQYLEEKDYAQSPVAERAVLPVA